MLVRQYNDLNLTFTSQGECINSTNNCYNHGACTLNGGDWFCLCKIFYDYKTNCQLNAQQSVWIGNDTFFWVMGLILSGVLMVSFLFEIILQFYHKKVRFNELALMRILLVLYTALRIIDYAFWGRNSIEDGHCEICNSIGLFFTFFPYILFVLCFKICVVIWYNLVLNLSFKSENYKLGKNIYIGISIFYTIGAIILIVFMCISLELFLTFVVYWIMIPLIGTIIHCYIQVYKLQKHLHDKSDPATRVAWKKNIILGILSIASTIVVILTVGMNASQYGYQVNWWAWLILYSWIRLFECVGLLLFFLFCEQYTFNLFSTQVETEKTKGTTHSSTAPPASEY
eukprot:TRINITY_DN24926_c0_g1_i1.p1 TRINITY_DN24926_c0_g1~~TRINITY_DN24926_c0_g1_i1.p1  ORF type:complete len:342 (+),score=70.55 TRINITY_DN24926_c0_g1_i1:26-1051(+)